MMEPHIAKALTALQRWLAAVQSGSDTRAIEMLAYGMQKLGSPAQPSETAQFAGK